MPSELVRAAATLPARRGSYASADNNTSHELLLDETDPRRTMPKNCFTLPLQNDVSQASLSHAWETSESLRPWRGTLLQPKMSNRRTTINELPSNVMKRTTLPEHAKQPPSPLPQPSPITATRGPCCFGRSVWPAAANWLRSSVRAIRISNKATFQGNARILTKTMYNIVASWANFTFWITPVRKAYVNNNLAPLSKYLSPCNLRCGRQRAKSKN